MYLEWLDEFCTVARCMSFTKAAKELNTTQPNLSRHIKQLENELGFELICHKVGSIELTGAGRKYADNVPNIQKKLAQLRDECLDLSKSNSLIKIQEPPYSDNVVTPYYALIENTFNPKQLGRCSYLNIHRCDLLDAVREHILDFAVYYGYGDSEIIIDRLAADDIKASFLCDVPLGIWIAKEDPITKLDVLSAEWLSVMPIVQPNDAYHPTREALKQMASNLGISIEFKYVNTTSQTQFFREIRPNCIFCLPLAMQCDARIVARTDLKCIPLKARDTSLKAFAICRAEDGYL